MLSSEMNKVQTKRATTSRTSRKTSAGSERHHEAISNRDLTRLAKNSHAHDWLRDAAEDIYTLNDGKPASWPARHTNGAA
jgi:hypothetical protein